MRRVVCFTEASEVPAVSIITVPAKLHSATNAPEDSHFRTRLRESLKHGLITFGVNCYHSEQPQARKK
jgi:hypothetical protein